MKAVQKMTARDTALYDEDVLHIKYKVLENKQKINSKCIQITSAVDMNKNLYHDKYLA